MTGRIWLNLGAGVLCLAALHPAHAASSAAAPSMPPPAVTVAPVEIKDISPATDYVGRVQAVQSVEIRAQVQGYLTNVAFQEGQTVKAGQVLFQIDRAPFEAALQSAKAQLEHAQASL
jgi:membrane fusion protein (multidrug efflux system)